MSWNPSYPNHPRQFAPMPNDNLAKGAALLVTGELLVAIMAAMIKHLSAQGLPTEVIVFFRNLLGLLLLLPVLAYTGGLDQLRTRRIGIHMTRAVFGVCGMFSFYYAIAHAPLAEAILVKMTTPFLLPLTAMFWLGDRINRQTWLAIGVGFMGIAFILRPGMGTFNPVLLVALLSAFLMSVAKVSIRRMADTEPPRRIVFWFTTISTLLSAIPLVWIDVLPDMHQLAWLLLIGLLATAGQIVITTAYQLASPGRIGVYNYASVLWAAILGWLYWGEALLWTTLAGTALIVGAGAWNLRQSR